MPQTRYSLTSLSLVFLASLSIIGSLAYLGSGLSLPLRLAVVVVSLGVLVIGRNSFRMSPSTPVSPSASHLSHPVLAGLVCYGLLVFSGLYQLIVHRSGRPLITPWEVIPSSHFILYGLSMLCLLYLLPRLQKKYSLLLLIVQYGWSFGIALIVYKLGYGYDPFIHQATVTAIEKLGRIYPTTFYYLGQYSLVTILHTIFGFTISLWDKLLVPMLAAIFLPIVLYQKLKTETVLKGPIALLLLLLPFTMFIVTTPQNLAYLWLIIMIFWSLRLHSRGDYIVVWLLACMTLFTQPIAGVPALFLAGLTSLPLLPSLRWQTIGRYLLLSGSVLALPLAFYVFTTVTSSEAVHITWPTFTDLFNFLIPKNPYQETWYLNFTYFFSAARGLLITLLILGGVYLAYLKRQTAYLTTYGLGCLALLLSAILASTLDFHFLIDYERSDYPQRILTVAILCTLPFIILTLEDIWQRLAKQTAFIRLSWLIFVTLLLSLSLYLSYPRFDHYYNSHGYASSEADLTAVHWINDHAGSAPYIVLANQQTSALAIREFGFKSYVNDTMFYYPVPTGGPLYQYYLKLVAHPEKTTVQAAMERAGVNQAYVVLNDYWWEAEKLGPELAAIADQTVTLQDGQIMVFSFTR